MGKIITTPFKSHNVFSLVVKEKHSNPTDWAVIKRTIQRLRRVLLTKNLSSFRIARRGYLIDEFDPGSLIEELVTTFSGTRIDVTVCYDQVELPKPEELKSIIETLHDIIIGGHKGINQTYRKICERYYWPSMHNYVLDYIRRCPQCQEKKIERVRTREPMIITDTPIEAFDKISIDTVGKLRTTPRGNFHLLTMQYNLTKYLIAIPIPNLKASTIADALARHLICQFGAPRAIPDRGTSYLSDIVEGLLRLFRIHHLTTSAYHPQANGSLERSHAPQCI